MCASFATTGVYDATGNFNPYSPAPTTAHIMWTKPTTFGGQPGGPIPGDEMHNFMTTTIISDFFEPIIIQGVLYYGTFDSLSNKQVNWNAVDLATGKTLWTMQPGVTIVGSTQVPNVGGSSSAQALRMGEVMSMHSMQEYGSLAVLYAVIGSTLMMYSPESGQYLGNITGMPVGALGSAVSFIQDENVKDPRVGSILGWYVSNNHLIMWNATQCWGGGAGTNQETLRIPATSKWNNGNEWNITLPTTLNGVTFGARLAIAKATSDVILVQYLPTDAADSDLGYAIQAGYNALTGQQLWMTNRTLPNDRYLQTLAANNDVWVMQDKDANQVYGFSMLSGKQLWGPITIPGNALSSLAASGDIAYGQVYVWDIGGYVNALNLTTGKIDWTYVPPTAGYNTPYGIYPLWGFGTQSKLMEYCSFQHHACTIHHCSRTVHASP